MRLSIAAPRSARREVIERALTAKRTHHRLDVVRREALDQSNAFVALATSCDQHAGTPAVEERQIAAGASTTDAPYR
jgi:hypothetical protein